MPKQKPIQHNELITVDTPLTYTMRQAAEILHTSPKGIYELIKAGNLKILRPRGSILIYRKLRGLELVNVINLTKKCVYNQQNVLKNFLFLKKFCFFLQQI